MIDPERIDALIREVAAEKVLPRFRNLAEGEVSYKAANDPVTIADVECEELLSARLTDALPGSVVVGEEAVAGDGATLQRLDGDGPLWIIDPIDGTLNFEAGLPDFGTMVALVDGGEIQAGWIHQPVAGTSAWALRGGGAWSQGRRLAVAAPPLVEMVGSVYGNVPGAGRAEHRIRHDGRLTVANRMCGATEYLRIVRAEGLHFSIHSRSLPWDHAAGAVIIEEAGGTFRFLDGSPYSHRVLDRPVMAAPNPDCWEAIDRILRRS